MQVLAPFWVSFDGGITNPQDGYGSWEVHWNGFKKRVIRTSFLAAGVGHRVTCNVAEWLSLKSALIWLDSVKDKHLYRIEIKGDSQLVISQLTGRYKAKNQNMKELRDGCLYYLHGWSSWEAKWWPRDNSVRKFGH